MKQLSTTGGGVHEAGCFVLGTIKGRNRQAVRCIYYDDLDPTAYATGVCVLDGNAFTRLWDICRSEKMSVIADIHTHPGAAFQSPSDRTNPMVARAGHLAIIVPNYAFGWIWRHRLGLYQYQGDHQWKNLSGWKARSHLKVGWSLI